MSAIAIFYRRLRTKEMAIDIVINAKLQRPSVCNAVETVIVHKQWPYIKELLETLHEKGVELRADKPLADTYPFVREAKEEDWATEFLAPILAVKLVETVDEAMEHIERYGTKHSEAIISECNEHVEQFFTRVDAAVLYHNASTRFTDGEQFGYGAEIGISTQNCTLVVRWAYAPSRQRKRSCMETGKCENNNQPPRGAG